MLVGDPGGDGPSLQITWPRSCQDPVGFAPGKVPVLRHRALSARDPRARPGCGSGRLNSSTRRTACSCSAASSAPVRPRSQASALPQSTVAEAAIRSAGVVDSRSRAAASAVSARWNGTRYTAGMVPPSIPGTGSRITPSAAASSARQARTRSAGTPRICAASVGDPAGGPRPDPLDQPRAEVAVDALDRGRQHRGVRLDLELPPVAWVRAPPADQPQGLPRLHPQQRTHHRHQIRPEAVGSHPGDRVAGLLVDVGDPLQHCVQHGPTRTTRRRTRCCRLRGGHSPILPTPRPRDRRYDATALEAAAYLARPAPTLLSPAGSATSVGYRVPGQSGGRRLAGRSPGPPRASWPSPPPKSRSAVNGSRPDDPFDVRAGEPRVAGTAGHRGCPRGSPRRVVAAGPADPRVRPLKRSARRWPVHSPFSGDAGMVVG